MAASVMRPVAGLITTELLTGLLLKCLGVEGEPGDPPAEVDPADDVHIRAAESNNLEPYKKVGGSVKLIQKSTGRELTIVAGSSLGLTPSMPMPTVPEVGVLELTYLL